MRLALLILVVMLAGCAITQKGALIQARKAYTEHDYNTCISKVESSLIEGEFADEITAELLFYKGLCLESAGRAPEAVYFYRRAIEKYPKTDLASQAAVRLKVLEPAK